MYLEDKYYRQSPHSSFGCRWLCDCDGDYGRLYKHTKDKHHSSGPKKLIDTVNLSSEAQNGVPAYNAEWYYNAY